MPMSVAERKHRMPHGGQKKAARLARVGQWYVSLVMSAQIRPQSKKAKAKLRRTQVAIATAFELPIEEIFDAAELSWGAQAVSHVRHQEVA